MTSHSGPHSVTMVAKFMVPKSMVPKSMVPKSVVTKSMVPKSLGAESQWATAMNARSAGTKSEWANSLGSKSVVRITVAHPLPPRVAPFQIWTATSLILLKIGTSMGAMARPLMRALTTKALHKIGAVMKLVEIRAIKVVLFASKPDKHKQHALLHNPNCNGEFFITGERDTVITILPLQAKLFIFKFNGRKNISDL